MKSASGIDRAELRDTPRIGPPRTRLLSSLDLKLLVLAFLLTGFTLAYPFGRDQGLFDVVGREWFRYGAVPYRDLVEQKPPPIFVVHGLLNLLLGDQTWGIRALRRTGQCLKPAARGTDFGPARCRSLRDELRQRGDADPSDACRRARRTCAAPPSSRRRAAAWLPARGAACLRGGHVARRAGEVLPLSSAPCLFGVVLALVLLVDDVARKSTEVAAAVVIGLTLTSPAGIAWSDLYPATLRHLAGDLDDRWFARPDYSVEDSTLVGMEIRRRAAAGDRLAVRGFEPQIYEIAVLRPATRFFWTNFITDPRRSMLHDEWLAEESAAIIHEPPRFVVATPGATPINGTAWFQERAPYVEVFASGSFRLLELSPRR